MKRAAGYALLILALCSGTLPAGRCFSILAGGCQSGCCTVEGDSCCRGESAGTLAISCTSCSTSEALLVQTSSSFNETQQLAAIAQRDEASDCFTIAALASADRTAGRQFDLHAPDTPLFIHHHTLLV